MAALTKRTLEDLLTRRARLKAPRSRLRVADDKVVGAVISDSFKGMTNTERMRKMRAALHGALDDRAARRIGMLLPYTDDEWDEPLEGMTTPANGKSRARKKAG